MLYEKHRNILNVVECFIREAFSKWTFTLEYNIDCIEKNSPRKEGREDKVSRWIFDNIWWI